MHIGPNSLAKRSRTFATHVATSVRKEGQVRQVILVESTGAILGLIPRRGLIPAVRVVLHIPGIPSEISRHWERVLNEALQDCGCRHGALIGALALFAVLAWDFSGVAKPAVAWSVLLSHTLIAAAAGGFMGKVTARARARQRILRIGREIVRSRPDSA